MPHALLSHSSIQFQKIKETKICKIRLFTFSSVSHTFHVANTNINHLVLGKERIFVPKTFNEKCFNYRFLYILKEMQLFRRQIMLA